MHVSKDLRCMFICMYVDMSIDRGRDIDRDEAEMPFHKHIYSCVYRSAHAISWRLPALHAASLEIFVFDPYQGPLRSKQSEHQDRAGEPR